MFEEFLIERFLFGWLIATCLCSKDREPGHFGRINIVVIGEWRVFIGPVGDFVIFDGPHLIPADLVVDGESDPPSVFELVEWILI